MRILMLLCCLAGPALAQDEPVCPANPDHAAAKTALLRDLRFARGQTEAQLITHELWKLWTDAPDDIAQDLLDDGMARRESYDFLGAVTALDRLVDYCPDFAEGYNQRAFAHYLREDYAAALVDLDRALSIDPQHIPALSGKALTLMGLGRDDEAQLVLRDAVRMNPFLGERALLRLPLGTDL